AVLREGRLQGRPVCFRAPERTSPAPRRPVDQLQLLRAQHHPRQHPARPAHDGVEGRLEDHLLRALERHRYRRMRVVQQLIALLLPCEGGGGLGRGAFGISLNRGHPLPASPCRRRGGAKAPAPFSSRFADQVFREPPCPPPHHSPPRRSTASASSSRAIPTARPGSSTAAPRASSTGTTSPIRRSTAPTRSSRPTSGSRTRST